MQCFFLVIAVAIHSGYGYLVNEWADRNLDRAQGKKNVFDKTQPVVAMLILFGLFSLALLSISPFLGTPKILLLWLCWIFFATAYSLKPFRLKERGVWGLFASTFAQWTLPILLGFAAFERFKGWDMVALTMAYSISGSALEIGHQRYDRERDKTTLTGTLGATITLEGLDSMYSTLLILDKIAVGVAIVGFSIGLKGDFPGAGLLGPLWPIMIFYLILFFFSLRESDKAFESGVFVDPYYSSIRNVHKFLHETISNFVIPVYLTILAATVRPVFSLLFFFFIAWRILLGEADWRWPLCALRLSLSEVFKDNDRRDP